MKWFPLTLLLLLTVAVAQAAEPNKITNEQHVATPTGGNIPPTQTIACLPILKVKNALTPVDLYKNVSACITQDKYEEAVKSFLLAGVYARFDMARIADHNAWKTKDVLIEQLFSSVPEDKKPKMAAAANELMGDPDSVNAFCRDMKKIGMPNYYPDYMISHGTMAVAGIPSNVSPSQIDGLNKDFDAAKTWHKLQVEAMHCTK